MPLCNLQPDARARLLDRPGPAKLHNRRPAIGPRVERSAGRVEHNPPGHKPVEPAVPSLLATRAFDVLLLTASYVVALHAFALINVSFRSHGGGGQERCGECCDRRSKPTRY